MGKYRHEKIRPFEGVTIKQFLKYAYIPGTADCICIQARNNVTHLLQQFNNNNLCMHRKSKFADIGLQKPPENSSEKVEFDVYLCSWYEVS